MKRLPITHAGLRAGLLALILGRAATLEQQASDLRIAAESLPDEFPAEIGLIHALCDAFKTAVAALDLTPGGDMMISLYVTIAEPLDAFDVFNRLPDDWTILERSDPDGHRTLLVHDSGETTAWLIVDVTPAAEGVAA